MQMVSSGKSDLCLAYVQNEIPKLNEVPEITQALHDHGKFTWQEVKKILTFGSGPTITPSEFHAGSVWDTVVQVTDPDSLSGPIFIKETVFEFTAMYLAEGRAIRARLAESERTKPNLFFFNARGQAIWGLGAIILESLVRFGVYRKTKASEHKAKGRQASTLFQRAVYGKAVVDLARQRTCLPVYVPGINNPGDVFDIGTVCSS